mmetsp:Transcript_19697/g.22677  ORF Transcript_19697/g.22677 Transcript_19697/m.22677 type:complete len:286 (+) Transcript_19697:45-902(+)
MTIQIASTSMIQPQHMEQSLHPNNKKELNDPNKQRLKFSSKNARRNLLTKVPAFVVIWAILGGTLPLTSAFSFKGTASPISLNSQKKSLKDTNCLKEFRYYDRKNSLSSERSGILRASTENFVTAAESSEKGQDWEYLAQSVFSDDDRPIILFDGICNLCNGAVLFALDHDNDNKFRFVSLQSQTGKSLLVSCGKSSSDTSSIILATGPTTCYTKSEAVLNIAKDLTGNRIFPLIRKLGKIVPGFAKNKVYDFVAVNRHRFGEYSGESCRLDFDGEFDDRFIADP